MVPVAADACLIPAGAPSADTVVVLLAGPLEARADGPGPSAADRAAERFLYQSLVVVDCQGSARPGLARRWRAVAAGWSIDLPPDHILPDGEPLDAAAVKSALERLALPGVAAVETRGDGTVVIRTAVPDSAFPSRLATDSALLRGPRRADGQSLETGAYRAVGRIGIGERESIQLARFVEGVPATVRIVLDPLTDPRDQLDRALGSGAGVLMITRDAATVEYASRLPAVVVRPLSWDRTYGLIRMPAAGDSLPGVGERQSLASEAVRGDVRASTADALCRPDGRAMTGRRRAVVGFLESDPAARQLAERIVSLASAGTGRHWVGVPPRPLGAVGYGRKALDSALAAGDLWGAVLGWRGPGCNGAPIPPGFVGIPLVESQSVLIRAGGVPTVEILRDGSFRFLAGR